MTEPKSDLNAAYPTADEARNIAALLQKIARNRPLVSKGLLEDTADFLLRCADRLEQGDRTSA